MLIEQPEACQPKPKGSLEAVAGMTPQQAVEFLGKVIQALKSRDLLEPSLRRLSSADWFTLYRAVIEVDEGL